MRTEIWLGDVLRALGADGIGDVATRRVVARLLGFSEDDLLLPEQEDYGRPPRDVSVRQRTAGEDSPPVPDEQPEPPEPPVQPEPPQEPASPELKAVKPTVVMSPPVPGCRDKLHAEPVPRPEPRHLTARPAHQGLLPPRSERSILQMMLSRPVFDGPVDVGVLVDTIARGLPIRELPRARITTSRFGVQVLVDTGPAMAPFRRDQDVLVTRVRAVVGDQATVVRYFAGTPSRGCRDEPTAEPKAYRPPAPGGKVLVLSDLGLAGRPDLPDRPLTGEWARFAALVLSRACAPVALVPVSPGRLNGALRLSLTLVSWDRSTTASRVRVASCR
ncbi:hypothetical protein ACFWMR_31185 [Amycolatopsis thailandensis]|uniref:hypothetical protein n=1 Tax=Amycolatopsis thailandensis TaxID=589330 RepID=UPI00364F6E66